MEHFPAHISVQYLGITSRYIPSIPALSRLFFCKTLLECSHYLMGILIYEEMYAWTTMQGHPRDRQLIFYIYILLADEWGMSLF